MSLEAFANRVRSMQVGSEAFNAFLSSTENKESLQSYAQSLGCVLTPEEQDEILSLRSTIYAKAKALPDAALDGVAGGLSHYAFYTQSPPSTFTPSIDLKPIATGFIVGALNMGSGDVGGANLGALADAQAWRVR